MGGVGVGTLTIPGPLVEVLIVTLIKTCKDAISFINSSLQGSRVYLIKSAGLECCASFLKVTVNKTI